MELNTTHDIMIIRYLIIPYLILLVRSNETLRISDEVF